MASNPSRVIVQLGANVEQLVAGMQQAISVMKGTGTEISGALKGISASSTSMASTMQQGFDGAALSVRNLLGPLASLFTAYQAFSAAKGFVSLGIETNAAMESATQGIAGLIMAQGTLKSANGETLTGERAYAAAMAMSTDQVQKLRVAGLQTAATTTQLTDAFKSAVAAGLASGLSLDQIRLLTVRITQAAAAMNVPMDQLRQEIVSILRATIDRNSVVAKNLNLTNEEIKQWKEAGTLFDNLNEKTAAFGFLGLKSLGTYTALLSNIRDAVAFLASATTKPLFESLKGGYGDLLGGMFNMDTATINLPMVGLVETLKSMFAGVGDLIRSWVTAAVSGLQSLASWLSENRERIAAFGAAVGAVAGAWSGALGNLLGALGSLASAGLGPLTAALNAVAAVLGSVTGQTLLFATIALNAVPRMLSLGGSIVGLLNPVLSVSRGAGALGAAFENVGLARVAAGMQSASVASSAFGSSIASLINPWTLLAGTIVGAAVALERYMSAARRTAEENARLTQEALRAAGDYRALVDEAVRYEKQEQDLSARMKERGKSEKELAALGEQLKAAQQQKENAIARLTNLYPAFLAYMKDETGATRSLMEARKVANTEGARDTDAQIAKAEEKKAQIEQQIASMTRATVVPYIGAIPPVPNPFSKWNLKELQGELASTKEKIDGLRAVKDKFLFSPEEEGARLETRTGEGETGLDSSHKVMEAFVTELEETKAKQANWYSWNNQQELAFWSEKIDLVKKGTDAYRQILTKVNQLTVSVGKEGHEQLIAQLKADADAMESGSTEKLAKLRQIVALETAARNQKGIVAAEKAVATEENAAFQKRIESLKAEASAERTTSEARVRLMWQIYAEQVRVHGAESAAAKKAAADAINAQHARNDELKRLNIERLADDAEYDVRDVEMEEERIERMHEALEIGGAKYIELMKQLEEQKFQIRMKSMQEELDYARQFGTDREIQELESKIRALTQSHENKLGGLDLKGKDLTLGSQLTAGFKSSVLGMTDTWAAGLQKMLQGQITFSQAIKGFWKSLADGIIGEMLRILTRWITTKALELLFHRTVETTKQQLTKQTGQVHDQTALQGASITAGAAMAEVGSSGASAAAKGADSVASVPYVGPILAVAAIAAILGAVLALRSNIRSAAGGFDVPAGLSPLTHLHPEEMVLPADLAGKVRAITAPARGFGYSGASAGTQLSGAPLNIEFHINALDGADVLRVLQRNKGNLVRTVADAHREGRFRAKLRNA